MASTRSSTATMATVAGSGEQGFADGPAAVAQFNGPTDVAVALDRSYFVADCYNHRVRRVTPDGAVTTVAGTGERGDTDGPGEVATFDMPTGIAVDRKGDVFVAQFGGDRIRRLTRRRGGGWEVSTVVAAAGGLGTPAGIAVDRAGDLLVTGPEEHRVWHVDSATGALAVVAGDGTYGFRDGEGATARFDDPEDVAVDQRGDIFVADNEGHRVRRISAADGVVTTVAGSGACGQVDGAGAAAQFVFPNAVAVDGRGVLIVADGDSPFRLRRVAASADRTVTTVFEDDTLPGESAGIAIDRDGSLLAAVAGANRIVRVTGLGLAAPWAPAWSLRAHRGLAAAAAEVATFVTTVMLCAMRLDARAAGGAHRGHRAAAAAVPRLPVEMWLAILAMLRPDQMVPQP